MSIPTRTIAASVAAAALLAGAFAFAPPALAQTDYGHAYGERTDRGGSYRTGREYRAEGYAGLTSYGRGDSRYAGDGRAGYRGDERRYAYDRDRRGDSDSYGGYRGGGYYAYPDYAYDPALGYEGEPYDTGYDSGGYDSGGYDEYSGFVAPPVYGDEYAEPGYGESYQPCGCRY